MDIKRLLVVKVRAMGDTLLATPALRALRRGFPDARLTVVVSPQGREVLLGNPDVDEVWVYQKNAINPWYHARFFSRLRKQAFDLGVALHATRRTAFMLWGGGVPIRVVHNHSGANYYATLEISAKKESKSAIERDLDAVRALGLNSAGAELVFNLEPRYHQFVKQFLNDHGLRARQYFVLIPGAGKERKQWTPAAVAAFLTGMRTQSRVPWVILAGPQDQALSADIMRNLKFKVPFFSRGLKEAGALLAHSRGVVTTDSGPKHIAVAVQARTLTLWTDEPEAEWHPYDLRQHALLRSPTGQVPDIMPDAVVKAAVKHFKLKEQP
jgi:ADP-heptose:LPS heptosyltransferase